MNSSGAQMAATQKVASKRAARVVIVPYILRKLPAEPASSLFLAFGPFGRNADAIRKDALL
jgi:hypothetical protein